MDDWREIAEFCLENEEILSYREVEFLNDILDNWEGDLTEAQSDWLSKINDKVEESGNG